MKKRGIRRRTRILFGIAILLIGVIGIILYRSAQSYIESEDARLLQREIIANTSMVESLSKDMWGAMCAYIVTGEEDFKQPYSHAQKEIDVPLARLKELTKDRPTQAENVSSLQHLIMQRNRYSSGLMAIRKENGFEAARNEVLKRQSAANMDSIRVVTKKIRQVATAELTELRTSHSNTVKHTFSAFIVLLGCTAVILLLAFIYINRAYRKLSDAEEELLQLNTDLDHKVRERTRDLSHQVNQFHTLTESLPQIVWTAQANGPHRLRQSRMGRIYRQAA